MTYTGKVSGGVVVLDPPAQLPEGAEVRVEVAESARRPAEDSLSAMLLRHAGKLSGLPRDLARNHDHYLHGRRRQ